MAARLDLTKILEIFSDPTKMVEAFLPLEAQVKIRVYRAKDKSLIIQIVPIDEKVEVKGATEK